MIPFVDDNYTNSHLQDNGELSIKVTGYLELYDFIYVYIYSTKTGILKS